ncbi:ABC transporter permease [Natronomonas marina]|uniref:ABC transporter permease n=1 Tax=Natronomonas marina TaxID=2961939 RepID=UPI0020C96AD4|nr:ABC transporter permease [Natronomonas marina]
MSRVAIARRELGSLSREKTIVLAILIQLVIAGFSSFLVVGLTSLYDPGAASENVEVAVTGEEADALVAASAEVEGVELVTYEDRAAARSAFQRNRVSAVVRAESSDGRVAVTADVPQSSLRKTLVVVQLRAVLEELERDERADRDAHLEFDPLPLPPSIDASPYFGFSYTVLLPLLVFLPVFISGAVVVDSLTEEIERGTLELLRVAPVSVVGIVDGKAGLLAALAPLQVLAWVALLEFNDIAIANVALLAVLASALAVVAVAFAAALAVAIPVRQRAQLTYSLGALAAFAAAAALPEHPATTVARLAIGSATTGTHLHLAGYVVGAAVAVLAVRRYAAGISPERFG